MTQLLRIIRYPDPRLRKRSEPVGCFDENLAKLVTQMVRLMHEAEGVGLAAPQVGINQRLFVMNPTGKPGDDSVYVNPTLSSPEDEEEQDEGCLSLPEIRIPVLRSKTLTIRAQDLQGRWFEQTESGFVARIWQHEYDHLEGILLLDRMTPTHKLQYRKILRELEESFAAG